MKKIGLTLMGMGLLIIIGILLVLRNNGTFTPKHNQPSVSGVATRSEKRTSQARHKRGKVLVVYMSHTGHTKAVARAIHRQVGGDLYELKTREKYPQKYEKMLKIARKEQDQQRRPKLAGKLPDLKPYRTIVLGYPIWLDKNPMAINTFLNAYPTFKGKTILPFTTSGSSGLGSSLTELKANAKHAQFGKGLAITADELDDTSSLVKKWVQTVGLTNN
ncbi:flavodoxin [Lactiplantibacillus garii]|uniref:Flavodoxin n=1 Tax=Lactiplantibacillus garii TaxID=2306423 RepID=A0A3R8J697_9LACO|nr:flavodoxin [Lactiplantibacillus garii]RRK09945.1 flavodoxin [Lactiplantibacillus garii]